MISFIIMCIDLVILRPMKDMLSKEIRIYNQFLKLDTIFTPTLTTMKSSKVSIDRLTEGIN
jgi:cytoplasmic tRNA 2-thiolation protein 2